MTTNPIHSTLAVSDASQATKQSQGGSKLRQVDPVRVLRAYAWLLIVSLVIGAGLGAGAWFGLRKTSPQFTSSSQLSVITPPKSALDMVSQGMDARESDAEIFMMNEIQRLTSEQVLRESLDREILKKTNWYEQFVVGTDGTGQKLVDAGAALEALKEDVIKASPIRGTTIIRISANTGSAEDSERVLEAVVQSYLQVVESSTFNKDDQLRRVLMQERDRLEEQSENLNQAMARFSREKDLAGIRERSNETSVRYETLSRRHVELSLALMEAQEGYNAMVAQHEANNFQPTPQDIVEIESHPEVLAISQRLNSLREQREAGVSRLGPGHFTVNQFDASIAAVEAERQNIIERKLQERQAFKMEQAASSVESLRSQLMSLKSELETAASNMANNEALILEYKQYQTKADAVSDRMAKIADQLDNMRVVRNRPDSVRVQVMTPPTKAELTFPKPAAVIPMVCLLFLGSVVGLVFLKEMLDHRVKSPADIASMPDVDVLGILPDAAEDPAGRQMVEGIVEKQPTGLMAESFRQLRTRVLREMDRGDHRVIAVCGAQAGSGVSSIVQNLATSLSLNGRKVLVIDGNFRRPAQHKLASLSNDRGLVEVLRGETTLDQVIRRAEGSGVSVITTGQSQQAAPELLESESFHQLLATVREQFDVVLMDTPPALIASETQMLASTIDAFVVTSRAEVDTRGMIQRVVRELGAHRARVLGVVLNGVRGTHGGYFRRSYQSFYKYQQDPANV